MDEKRDGREGSRLERARPIAADLVPAVASTQRAGWVEVFSRPLTSTIGTVFIAGAVLSAALVSRTFLRPIPEVIPAAAQAVPAPRPEPQAAPDPEPRPDFWQGQPGTDLDPRRWPHAVRARPSAQPEPANWPDPDRPGLEHEPQPLIATQTGVETRSESLGMFNRAVDFVREKGKLLKMSWSPTKSAILGMTFIAGRFPGNVVQPNFEHIPSGGPAHLPESAPALNPFPQNPPAVHPMMEHPGAQELQPVPGQGPDQQPPQPARGLESAAAPGETTSDGSSAPPSPGDGFSPPPGDGTGAGLSDMTVPKDTPNDGKTSMTAPPIPMRRVVQPKVIVPIPVCQMRPLGALVAGVNFDPHLPFCNSLSNQSTDTSGVASDFGLNGSAACNSSSSTAADSDGEGDAGAGDGDGGSGDGGGSE